MLPDRKMVFLSSVRLSNIAMTKSSPDTSKRRRLLSLLVAISPCLGGPIGVWAQLLPADASSESGKAPHNDYAKLTDGDLGRSSFVVFEKGGNSYVTLDLGESRPADRLVIVGRSAAGVPAISSARIEVSGDGQAWTEVAAVDNAQTVQSLAGTPRNSGGTLSIGFPEQNARYVRLHLNDPSKSEQIGELLVFHRGGPRVSLVDRGAQLNMSADGLTEKYPYYLVDGVDDELANFVLYSGTANGPVTGDFTLRLESPEYAEGWNKVVLSGRGTQPKPSNPPTVTISVADSFEGPFTGIHTESFPPATKPWKYELEMPAPRKEKYVKVAWTSNDKSPVPLNIQFTEVDVVPTATRP